MLVRVYGVYVLLPSCGRPFRTPRGNGGCARECCSFRTGKRQTLRFERALERCSDACRERFVQRVVRVFTAFTPFTLFACVDGVFAVFPFSRKLLRILGEDGAGTARSNCSTGEGKASPERGEKRKAGHPCAPFLPSRMCFHALFFPAAFYCQDCTSARPAGIYPSKQGQKGGVLLEIHKTTPFLEIFSLY